jgi:predicted peptidase
MVRNETGEAPRWAERGTLDDGWDLIEQDLLTMIDATIADFRGDADRVYCTGLSYGGFGTWHMAQTHPERFAAVGPICGAGDPRKMQPIVDAMLPIWIHQGGRDPVVAAEHVLASARALEAAGHPEVRMTVHEDLSHNVWTRVYEGDDLYNWFLRQRRSA